MAEEVPAQVAAPAKAAKKKVTKPKKSTGPGVRELIVKAVSVSKDRKGVSAAALKKDLTAAGYDVEKNKTRFKIAVRKLVDNETLIQLTGIGVSGSFKLGKKAAEPKAKKIVKKVATKAKKTAVKKPAATKKPKVKVAKKTAATKKSPKKVKKPIAVKKTAKSPKKVTKSPKKAVKKPKTPAAKAPAKKAAKQAAKPKVKKTAAKKK